jgi:hypothetical protein
MGCLQLFCYELTMLKQASTFVKVTGWPQLARSPRQANSTDSPSVTNETKSGESAPENLRDYLRQEFDNVP